MSPPCAFYPSASRRNASRAVKVNSHQRLPDISFTHFLSITEGRENLRELGRKALWNGAQDILFEAI